MAPEERREQLLDAALRIIVNQGIHKVSIDTVATEVGVSRPVIYGLFADSNELLRASLDREETAGLAQLAEVAPRTDTPDRAGAVVESLARFLSAVQAAPDRWRAAFLLVDSSTPTFRRRMESGRRAFIAALGRFIDTVTPAELADTVDTEMAARTLFALYWDAGRLILAEPDTFPADRILTFYEVVIRALPMFRTDLQ